MVHSNKYLWELIISRREYIQRQRANAERQKESDLEQKLVQLQKPTSAQIDDKVDGKIAQAVPGTVRAILDEDLNLKAFKKNKREKSLNTASVSDGMMKTQPAQKENNAANKDAQPAVPIVARTPQAIPPIMQANQTFMGQNPPMIQLGPTEKPMLFQSGQPRPGQMRGRGWKGCSSRGSTNHTGIFDAYCMDTAPRILKNEIISTLSP